MNEEMPDGYKEIVKSLEKILDVRKHDLPLLITATIDALSCLLHVGNSDTEETIKLLNQHVRSRFSQMDENFKPFMKRKADEKK